MAKKNNQTPESGEQTPVDNDQPVSAKPVSYAELRSARRELEAELSGMDGQIRNAIDLGDVDMMARLTARKKELPGLFVAASMAETKARQEAQNTADAANVKRLESAQADRDKAEAALIKRKIEVDIELADLAADLEAAAVRVSEAYDAINTSRLDGAIGEAGFRKSLAALSGV